MMKNKKKLTFVIGACVLVMALVAAGAFVMIKKNDTAHNCDEIVASFNQQAKTNPLMELTAPVAECMQAK